MRAKPMSSYGRLRSRASASSMGTAPRRTSASRSASCFRSMATCSSAALVHAQLLHRACARARHLETHPPRAQAVARLGHTSEPLEDEAPEGLLLALRQVPAEALVHLRHRSPRAHHVDSGRDAMEELPRRIIF